MARPQSRCRGLGRDDRIRVPSPAASTTAGAWHLRDASNASGIEDVAFDLSSHPSAASLIGRGNIKLHFRSEAAQVVTDGSHPGAGESSRDAIRLPGAVEQTAYLGEHWRCRVRMGSASIWVDTTTPLTVGAPAVVQVPVRALHLFAA